MGRILLVRHAESEGNRAERFTATPAVPLTALGREQARVVAERLRSIAAPVRLVASPYARAQETAGIIATMIGLPVVIEEDFRERSYGSFAGQPYSTPRPDYDPTRYWEWRPPGGEDLVQVLARAGSALDRVRRFVPEGDAIVVSHGAVMMALWRHVMGDWGPRRVTPNAGIVVATHDRGGWRGAEALPHPDPK